MIFSAKKWADSDELNRFIPVSAGLSFDKVESSLEDAFRLFVLPLFGQDLSDDIRSYYDNPDASDLQHALLEECQRAVANLAFWYNYTELNIRITDQGMQRQESDGSFKQAYKYQEDALKHSFKNKGFNALDRMIEFLDVHQDEFPHYKDSPAYARRTRSIVRNTAEVDRTYFINNSHIIFLRLKPYFKLVEETVLQPVLGTDLYDKLVTSLQEEKKDLGSTTTEELRSRCATFVILKSIAELIRATGSLTDRGLYFVQLLAGDGNTSAAPADREDALSMAAHVELNAKAYHDLLVKFIETSLPEFFKGRQSDILNRDNDNKRTFWA